MQICFRRIRSRNSIVICVSRGLVATGRVEARICPHSGQLQGVAAGVAPRPVGPVVWRKLRNRFCRPSSNNSCRCCILSTTQVKKQREDDNHHNHHKDCKQTGIELQMEEELNQISTPPRGHAGKISKFTSLLCNLYSVCPLRKQSKCPLASIFSKLVGGPSMRMVRLPLVSPHLLSCFCFTWVPHHTAVSINKCIQVSRLVADSRESFLFSWVSRWSLPMLHPSRPRL